MKLVYKTGSIFVLPANKHQGDLVEIGDKVTLAAGLPRCHLRSMDVWAAH